MKIKQKSILILTLAALLLLQGCIHIKDKDPADTTGGDAQASIVHYYINMEYAYMTSVDQSLLTTQLDPTYLLLANKTHALTSEFVPPSLVTLDCPTYGGKTVELDARAAGALEQMMREMNAAGVTDIYVTSGYRTYEYQVSLFNHYLSEEQKGISEDAVRCLGLDYINAHYTSKGITKLSPADARTVVLSYSAYPGTSEHQTALCVDLITSSGKLDVSFAQTDAFAWLSQNAYRFGFILRYPEGKEEITGYSYEPWHYRFVGREAATDIHFGGLTLEDYLGK